MSGADLQGGEFPCSVNLTLAFPHFDRWIHVCREEAIGEGASRVIRLANDRALVDNIVSVVEEIAAVLVHRGRLLLEADNDADARIVLALAKIHSVIATN